MKEWIPFLQTLVWPLFLGILICVFRETFKEILDAVKVRIEKGSPFGVGPGGLSVGQPPRLPDDPTPEERIDDGTAKSSSPEILELEKAIEEQAEAAPADSLQLVHRTRFLRIKNDRPYYRITVSLDGVPSALAEVERVVYYLHRTFNNPVREIMDAKSHFALKTAAWGEFTIRADVFLKGQKEPLRLSRYLDIKPVTA